MFNLTGSFILFRATLTLYVNESKWNLQYKVGSGLDVVVEAVDTTPSVPSFKQHTWPFLLSTLLFGQKY